MLNAIKVRLYPTSEQEEVFAKSFGCARWYWNYSLNACIQHYQQTGKSLPMKIYKGMLPQLKVEHPWLKTDCYSSVLQCVAINLNKAYTNFFEGRARFPKFKSKHDKQSIQYPQNVTVVENCLNIPKIGVVKAVFHREIKGVIKTVTISKTPTDKYFASILCDEGLTRTKKAEPYLGISCTARSQNLEKREALITDCSSVAEIVTSGRLPFFLRQIRFPRIIKGFEGHGARPEKRETFIGHTIPNTDGTSCYQGFPFLAANSTAFFEGTMRETENVENQFIDDKVLGIDLGIKDFAIVHDGTNVTKYSNPKHIRRHEKNLARKQQKLARKKKSSKSRAKAKKLVAKVHEKVSNSRQDFLHKVSRKLVDESEIITVENLNVKGLIRNRKLSKSISDAGWGMFVNFLDYKLKRKGGQLIEIDRFFPSSKMCSNCGHVIDKLTLDIREWECPSCKIYHDRDGNASLNIRNEGIRILNSQASPEVPGGGNPVTASGDCVRPNTRKGKGRRSAKLEANTVLGTPSQCG